MSDYPIENKVAKSGLVVLEMDDFASTTDLVVFDIKDQLWQEMALKEKDFRAFINSHDWEQYRNKTVTVYCSVDAIVPHWAYMLIATKLGPVADQLYFLPPEDAKQRMTEEAIESLDLTPYKDARVIVKGCGDNAITPGSYGLIAEKLLPVVKSLMFGEPCSTVPVYKKPK